MVDVLKPCVRKEVTSSEHEHENRPVHVREIGRSSDNQSRSDSNSDESGGCRSPDRRSPEEVGRHRVSEKHSRLLNWVDMEAVNIVSR